MSHAITPSGRAVNPWWIALTLTIATFMELLDTSIANVSLPHIAGGLGTSLDEATWVLTSYLVANAVVLPLSAWLSRVFGRPTPIKGRDGLCPGRISEAPAENGMSSLAKSGQLICI